MTDDLTADLFGHLDDDKAPHPHAGVERPDWWNLVARRKLGRGAAWEWFEVKRVGMTNDALVTGAVPIGVRKNGRPKFPRQKDCERVVVTQAEVDAEQAAWELATGKCAHCVGTGQEWAGWSIDTGHRARTCHKCTGTGTPSGVDAAPA